MMVARRPARLRSSEQQRRRRESADASAGVNSYVHRRGDGAGGDAGGEIHHEGSAALPRHRFSGSSDGLRGDDPHLPIRPIRKMHRRPVEVCLAVASPTS